MKTLQDILQYSGGANCNLVDGRDRSRLIAFVAVADWPKLGLTPKEGLDVSNYVPEPFTRENVLKHLASDLDFAFEKALGQRGISSSLMFDVIKMWMWVLDDELQHSEDYAYYGLPLYRAVAVKYELPNPIGDDLGNEKHYGCSN